MTLKPRYVLFLIGSIIPVVGVILMKSFDWDYFSMGTKIFGGPITWLPILGDNISGMQLFPFLLFGSVLYGLVFSLVGFIYEKGTGKEYHSNNYGLFFGALGIVTLIQLFLSFWLVKGPN